MRQIKSHQQLMLMAYQYLPNMGNIFYFVGAASTPTSCAGSGF